MGGCEGRPLRFTYRQTFRRRETGLLFVCFQREPDTFVRTQHRLDEADALTDFVTPTASATFLVLPGFDATRPLGSTLTG
ncbi:hypothetical protein [Promicromonospora sp. NPDC050249]|uniref:hypothetical protein n=1 Tax=Promicromonospora sp. NPDC050249 TaxID=3154743 RepID=UPI0033CD733C